jgi:hypothetical protein
MKVSFLASIALALACGCASHKQSSKAAKASQEAKSPYDIPLSTPGARFGSLPAVVQATVLSEAGTASIYDIYRDISGEHVIYKIFFVDAVNYPPLWVGGDGSVLNRDLTVAVPGPRDAKVSIPVSDLPTTVLKVLENHPPGAEILNISREYWGDHQIYIIAFKDDLKYGKIYVAADGTIIVQGPK